ncbi:MAG: hypothetical protein AAB677_00465 [Patescibacteria group bacterium]
MNFWKNTKKRWRKYKKEFSLFVLFSLLLTIIGLVNYWPVFKSKLPTQNIKNSPDSINTIGQTGGSNQINNIYPKPTLISKKYLSINIPDGDYYKHELLLSIKYPSVNPKIRTVNPRMVYKLLSFRRKSSAYNLGGSGTFPSEEYVISFLTFGKIEENDITFQLF